MPTAWQGDININESSYRQSVQSLWLFCLFHYHCRPRRRLCRSSLSPLITSDIAAAHCIDLLCASSISVPHYLSSHHRRVCLSPLVSLLLVVYPCLSRSAHLVLTAAGTDHDMIYPTSRQNHIGSSWVDNGTKRTNRQNAIHSVVIYQNSIGVHNKVLSEWDVTVTYISQVKQNKTKHFSGSITHTIL